jgi:hypothetical protein
MSFEQLTFLGASITDFSTSIGWNGEQTSVLVNLVEDLKNGDDYDPPQVGQPVAIEFGDFYYRGLLQNSTRMNSFSGNPIYKAVITDTKDILDGAQVILNSYAGSTSIVKNLINAYGYLEVKYGFGGSLVNESGIPWFLVKEALNWIINISTDEYFGGKLNFRGIHYGLDLSEMPEPPFYYRVGGGGGGQSLLDIISQICLDGGHDFFLALDEDDEGNNTIRIRTVSRVLQPQLTLVQDFIDEHTDSVVSKDLGRELRNEVTSAFLLGGQKETIFESDTVAPYWGIDDNNHPILGTGTGDDHTFRLQSEEVADVIGAETYQCTIEELTYALVDQNSWQTYMRKKRASLCATIGLDVRINVEGITRLLGRQQIVNPNRQDAERITNYLFTNVQSNVRRLYDFVRKIAQDFYGRRFVARIPFVLLKIESETSRIVYSQEPTQSGWVSSGTALGLNQELALIFQDQQGKLECFVRFDNVGQADASTLALGDDSVIQDGHLFVKATMDPNIYYANNIPCVLLTLNRPLWEKPATPHGDLNKVATMLNWPLEKLLTLYSRGKAGGGFSLSKHPLAYGPQFAAIPLKSNTDSYGPWFYNGQPGKVMYEKDDSLVPWEYGRVDILNASADARISSAVTSQVEAETGDIQLAGAPIVSIGDELVEGGPIVTTMNVRYGGDGVTTNYGLQTYTARFGFFTKGTVERLRRYGQSINRQRNLIKQALAKQLRRQQLIANRNPFFDYTQLIEINPRTPHNMIQAYVNDDETFAVPSVSFATQDEARASCNANDTDAFKNNSAFMDLGGLFRPFTTERDHSGAFPKFNYEDIVDAESVVTRNEVNPFKRGSDIQVVSYSDQFETWFTYDEHIDPETDKVRGFGLRLPAMGVGWGYGMFDGDTPEDVVGDDYLKDNGEWKAGPIDHVWDKLRGCWTSHDLIPCYAVGEISGGGTGEVRIYGLSNTITITNLFSAKWKAGKFGIVGYTPYYRQGLIAIDFDC